MTRKQELQETINRMVGAAFDGGAKAARAAAMASQWGGVVDEQPAQFRLAV